MQIFSKIKFFVKFLVHKIKRVKKIIIIVSNISNLNEQNIYIKKCRSPPYQIFSSNELKTSKQFRRVEQLNPIQMQKSKKSIHMEKI